MIKQIKLEQVEKYIQRKLKRNHTSLGFDVSLHSTGIVMLKTTNTNLIIDHTQLLITPKDVAEEKGLDIFTSQLDEYKNKVVQKYSIDSVIIENCFFGMSVTVLKALARCSGLARDRFKNISKECYFKYPKEIRAIVGFYGGKVKGSQLKNLIVDFVNKALKLELKYKEHDLADAYMCSLMGLIEK